MDLIRKTIIQNRPNISDQSVRSYVACLKRIIKHVDKKALESVTPDFFSKNKAKILAFLDSVAPNSAKTSLAALVVLTTGLPVAEEYKDRMATMATDHKERQRLQQANPGETVLSWKVLQQRYRNMWGDFNPLFQLDSLNQAEFVVLRDLVLAAMYMLIPPRRIKDYTDFKIKNINKSLDNYLQDGKKPVLVFNSYKTAKFYGAQEVEVPSNLYHILKRWMKLNPGEYLFSNTDGSPLKQAQVTTILNKIFGPGASVNTLRHSYISAFLRDSPKLTDMENLAQAMGHNVDQQQLYRRL